MFDNTPETEAFVESENPYPVFSLDGLIWWLERKVANGNGGKEYDWADADQCALGQYITARGGRINPADKVHYQVGTDRMHIGDSGDNQLTQVSWDTPGPYTFQAALHRARSLKMGV